MAALQENRTHADIITTFKYKRFNPTLYVDITVKHEMLDMWIQPQSQWDTSNSHVRLKTFTFLVYQKVLQNKSPIDAKQIYIFDRHGF